MTNKERLEKIKEIDITPLCFYLDNMTNFDGKLLKEQWEWLIKQAERVEELEKEVSDWRAEVQKWQKFYKESEEDHLETKGLLKNIYELAEYDEYDNTLEQIVQKLKKHWRRVKND